TITTESASGTGASVQVTVTSQPCAHANPSLAVSPSTNGWVSASTATSYTLTVTNNDASSCSPASFNLAASVPSGWSAAFANPSLTLNPGASASTTVTLTSGSLSPAGAYTVTLSASNS